MELQELLKDKELLKNLIASGVLFVALLLIRLLATRSITNSKTIPKEHRRQWIVKTKTIILFIFLLGLLIIWASQLQNFAVTLVAVAAAIVIALKEVIMNVSGYFSRASAKPFSIGDRIEINGIRGDVIDQNLFFTNLLEIGPGHATNQYTGRSINIPNSAFLSQTIINESFTEDYTLHVFRVPLQVSNDIEKLQSALLEASKKHCEVFMVEAEKEFRSFKKQGLEPPSVEPRVHIHYLDKDTVELIARIPAPTSRKGRVEQDILKDFTTEFCKAQKQRASEIER